MHAHKAYLPAFGRDSLLALYDPVTCILGTRKVHRKLIELAEMRPGHRVLDIGCGTGSLIARLIAEIPGAIVHGLDPDPNALRRARRKIEASGQSATLDHGYADALPYPARSFDRVLSSLMFHHLDPADKLQALREVRRVLKPGGSLLLVDFGAAPAERKAWLSRRLHSNERLKDSTDEQVLAWMRGAGFTSATMIATGSLLVGQVSYYKGTQAS